MSSSLYRFIRLHGAYKKLRRVKDIAAILARHGFADVAHRTRLGNVLRVARKIVSLGHWKDKEAISTGARLRSICEELGATFIKFGQVLATRPDLLGPEVIAELSQLQDNVPPFPFEQVEEIITAQLGGPISEVFASLDPKPIAAASIAQVHCGYLVNGDKVALKVKRPNLDKSVRQDLAVMRDIAAYIEDNFDGIEHIHPRSIVEEFARTMGMEMDLRSEARNIERFARNFEDESNVRVPRVYQEHSSASLLVMEFMDGRKVTQVENWDDFPMTPKEIAELGTRLLLRSVFEFRFYHADPHPGNFMIGPDGKVCLLDFGMVGFVGESRVEELLSFMVALVSHDARMLVEAILQSGLAPATLEVREFTRDVEFLMNQFSTLRIEEMDLEMMLRMAIETIYKHRISLPADLLGVARAISTMEGIARQIYPQFSPVEAVQPYFISLFIKRALDPAHQAEQIVDGVMDMLAAARRLPEDLADVIMRLKRGELKLKVEDTRAIEVARIRAAAMNHAAGAMVAGVGVAGSALLYALPSVPEWVAIVSLASSFLVSINVLRNLRKSGGA